MNLDPQFPDSQSLYAACQSSDTTVQAQAYTSLWHYLYRAVYHIVRNQPEPEAMAQDLTQIAIERIHQRLDECREPAAFRSWSRRIVSNLALDELRRRKRLIIDESPTDYAPPDTLTAASPEKAVTELTSLSDLTNLLEQAPISGRSRRVVSGRYITDLPDEQLAATESQLSGKDVLPSHIQVTRAKNISKLKTWTPIQAFFGKVSQ